MSDCCRKLKTTIKLEKARSVNDDMSNYFLLIIQFRVQMILVLLLGYWALGDICIIVIGRYFFGMTPIQYDTLIKQQMALSWCLQCCCCQQGEWGGVYVSSAYLHRLLPGMAVVRSVALTTYETGPIVDPCMILAMIFRSADIWHVSNKIAATSRSYHLRCWTVNTTLRRISTSRCEPNVA